MNIASVPLAQPIRAFSVGISGLRSLGTNKGTRVNTAAQRSANEFLRGFTNCVYYV